jgi:hypothetical protein
VEVVAVVVSGAPEVLEEVSVELLTVPGATSVDVDVLGAAELDVEPASGGRVIDTPSTSVRGPASGAASCPLRATPTAVAAPMSTMMNAARPRISRRWRPVVPPPPACVAATFFQIADSRPAGGGTAARAAKIDIGVTRALRLSSHTSHVRVWRSTARRNLGVTGGSGTEATMSVRSSQSLDPFRIRR